MGFEAATPVSSDNSSRDFDIGHWDGPSVRNDVKIYQIAIPLSVGLCASWKECQAGVSLGLKFFNLLTLRLLMSYIYIYIYGAPILDVSRSHTTTQHSR